CKAGISVVWDSLLSRRLDVRVVTRNATQLAVAFLKATALVHLFDMIDRLVAFGVADEYGPKFLERKSRPEIELASAATNAPDCALEMALLTDGLAEFCR